MSNNAGFALNVREVMDHELEGALQVYASDEGILVTDVYRSSAIVAYHNMRERGSVLLGAFATDGDLLGCLSLHFLDDIYPGYEDYPYAHFETIIVRKDSRGKGVGTSLVQKAMELCKTRGVTYVNAQTEEKNLAMRRVYEKCGLRNKHVNYHAAL